MNNLHEIGDPKDFVENQATLIRRTLDDWKEWEKVGFEDPAELLRRTAHVLRLLEKKKEIV